MTSPDGSTTLDSVTHGGLRVTVSVRQGWCGSIQHNPEKMERAASQFCRMLVLHHITHRCVSEVRHG